MKTLTLLTILVGGCGGHYSIIEGQNVAVYTVWNLVYGMNQFPAPPIQWATAKDLTCAGGRGFPAVDGIDNGACLGGEYFNPPEDYIILIPNPNGKWSDGNLAHELNHARLEYTKHDVDNSHLRPSWQDCEVNPTEPDCGRMDEANAALRLAGL